MFHSESKMFYINGASRLTGTNSNFTHSIQIPSNSEFDRVVILQLCVPASMYVVPANYNTFVLTEGSTSITIAIPPGNYNANSFLIVLKDLLNHSSPNGLTYNITYPNSFNSANTGKFTYTVTGSSTVSFTFSTNLYEQFGFYDNSVNTFVAGALVSANVIKFYQQDCIFIHSDICSNSEQAILQECYFNNTNLSNMTYMCPDPQAYSKKLNTNKANVYTFSITDEIGREIDLNGLNWGATLLLFKRDDFTEVFKTYMKYNLLQN